jgi:hypothetical protein
LISMRERLQLVNGDFSLESTLNSGTTIQASVHVREDQIQPEDRKQPIAS